MPEDYTRIFAACERLGQVFTRIPFTTGHAGCWKLFARWGLHSGLSCQVQNKSSVGSQKRDSFCEVNPTLKYIFGLFLCNASIHRDICVVCVAKYYKD